MGRVRGKKKHTLGKILGWKNKRAAKGRKPNLGKRKHFMTWKEVRAKIQLNKTAIIVPPKAETAETEEAASS